MLRGEAGFWLSWRTVQKNRNLCEREFRRRRVKLLLKFVIATAKFIGYDFVFLFVLTYGRFPELHKTA